MQVKLLRAIQEKRVRKVGSTAEEGGRRAHHLGNSPLLKDCVDAGTFRQDLYYRVNVIELKMPPLREREEDVEPWSRRCWYASAERQPPRLQAQALTALKAYSFPGNVRELENILERATALCNDGTVALDDLQLAPEKAVSDSVGRDGETLDDYLNRVERQAILEALAKTAFNRTAAARLLGVTFRSLRYRIERLGIEE
jgi:two-component system response regulator PilR (NtrC family)